MGDTERRAKRWDTARSWVGAGVVGLVGLVLFTWVWTLPAELPREYRFKLNLFGWQLTEQKFTRELLHSWLEDVQGWALLALGLLWLFRAVGPIRRWRHVEILRTTVFAGLLGLTVFTSVVTVMQFGAHRYTYFDVGDTYHYYLGPKYFHELKYNDLYVASVVAREEQGEKPPFAIRDLKSNNKERTARLINDRRRKQLKSHFTPERWEAFKTENDIYRRWHNDRAWHRRLLDHGYNGSPPLVALGSFLANTSQVSGEVLNRFASLNTLAVFLFLVVLVWGVGWELGLLVAILFWVNICDRFILGGAFLRYFWVSALGAGVVFVVRRRFATAGALIASAASLQVFPILFLFGMLFRSIWTFLRTRRFPRRYRRFAAGAAGAFVVWGVFTLVPRPAEGLNDWRLFLDQMKVEARYADGRLGFVYNFLFPKTYGHDDRPPYFEQEQLPAYEKARWGPLSRQDVRKGLTVLFLLALLLALRRMTDLEATVLVGAALFFYLFSTVRYYYAGWAMVPLFWASRRRRWDGALGIAVMLAVSIEIYRIHDDWSHAFIHNSVYCWFYTGYLGLLVIAVVATPARQLRWVPGPFRLFGGKRLLEGTRWNRDAEGRPANVVVDSAGGEAASVAVPSSSDGAVSGPSGEAPAIEGEAPLDEAASAAGAAPAVGQEAPSVDEGGASEETKAPASPEAEKPASDGTGE